MTVLLDTIKLKRGNQTAVDSASLERGEPAIAMDTRSLWVGDGTGKIKISDIVVAADYASLPGTGETGKLYLVVTDEGKDNETTLYVYKAAAYVLVTSGAGSIDAGDITDLDTAIDSRVSGTWRGQVDGVAPLDSGSKIPNAYLPDLAISSIDVVADNTARDALTPGTGDVAVVTGTGITYMWSGSAWVELLTAPDGVVSVNGYSGPSVTLTTTDIAEGNNQYYTGARAKADVIDDSKGTGDTDFAWSANKVEVELAAHDNKLGTKTIDEGALGDGKLITYNGTSGNMEYHAVVIDGGEL